MQCYYEVLEVSRDATQDDIKKAYRRMAVVWHPDKNIDQPELAEEKFKLITAAKEVLSDPHKRQWYDDHREQILSGTPATSDSEGINLFPYFNTSCFHGNGDDDKGFFTVYRSVFNEITLQEAKHNVKLTLPSFGTSQSSIDDVKTFYASWLNFVTCLSFAWMDKYDVNEAPNRYVRRLIEKDNQKERDKAKKSYVDLVRRLAEFAKKFDIRMKKYHEQLQKEKEALIAQRQKEIEAEKLKKAEMAKQYEEEHAKFTEEYEAELRQRGFLQDDNDEEVEEEGEEEDFEELYCAACNRYFRTTKQFANHETSKKHKDAVDRIKFEVYLSDDESGSNEEPNTNEVTEDSVQDVAPEESSEEETGPKLSKKARKKLQKQEALKSEQKSQVESLSKQFQQEDEEEDEEAEIQMPDQLSSRQQKKQQQQSVKKTEPANPKKKPRRGKKDEEAKSTGSAKKVAPKPTGPIPQGEFVCTVCCVDFGTKNLFNKHQRQKGHMAES